ncbi:MAG: hypothetical protein SPK23_04165 [Eubacteriales bacterium]|nr:hypothetical protein [Clostridiales bacterium]MDY5836301.1 hypothetical protein [Eubacteriales bacterium]
MIRKIQLWLINRKNIVKMSKFSLLTVGLPAGRAFIAGGCLD